MSDTHGIPEKKWQTILSIAISAFGILYFLFQALGIGLIWLMALLDPQSAPVQALSSGLLVWGSVLSAVLLVPVLILSIKELKGQQAPTWLDTDNSHVRKAAMWSFLFWPLVVFLGWLVAGNQQLAVFLLGPINLLVAGLPVLLIFNAGQWKLKAGSPLRKWRIFGFSLTLMPVIVIVVELIAILAIGLVIGLYIAYQLSVNPLLERELMFIITQISIGRDLDTILRILKPYVLQPVVIFGALAIFAGVMPMIEEILKPIALWALAGRKITPREGFVGGLLCGAGFALMENVLYFSMVISAEDWLFTAIGRAGTGVLHMLASGLVGWGLAKVWQEGKWIVLAWTTLAAIIFHGLWNALALVAGVAPLYVYGAEPTFGQTMLFYAPLILLLILASIALYLLNHHFQRQQASEAVSGSIN